MTQDDYSTVQNKGKIVQYDVQNKGKILTIKRLKMTQREILLEMYEKLWNADKDKWAWNVILKDTLEKLETNNDTEQ